MNDSRHSLLRSGIRRRLFALALGLTIPLALLAGVRAFERAQRDQRALAERGITSARRATQLLEDDLHRARLLLNAAARVLHPDVSRATNDSLIRVIFADAAVGFSNIWIADSLGVLKGAMIDVEQRLPPGSDATLRSREYFVDAVRTKDFTIGQPVRSQFDPARRWVIPFVNPVHGPDGRVIAYVGAGLKVDQMAAMLYTRDLPPNSVLTVLRDDGRVFLRSLDLESWITRDFRDSGSFRRDSRLPRTFEPIQSLDGTRRLVAQDTLSTIKATAYLGIPVSETLASVERQFFVDLLAGALLTMTAALVALYIANRIASPIDELASIAQALARGEQHRRAVVSGSDEVAILGQAVNAMADAAQERQAALASSERRYRQLFATSPLPTITWRLNDGRIEQLNDAARAFFGDDSLTGTRARILDLIQPADRERFSALPMPELAETVHAGQWIMPAAGDQLRTVELYVGRLEEREQVVAVGVILDISDRIHAQSALEASRAQLRQAQQLEALGSFAGGIAHDFNNYLSAISTNAEILRDDLPATSSLRNEAREILLASQRAANLTRQILVFSRRQVVREEVLDINRQLETLQHMLARLLGDHVALEMSCADFIAPVRFAQDGLEQVLMNLAANARDAMPSGGTLSIVTDMKDAQTVRIVVRDTGNGIADDVLPRIFEPFFTTKTRERGTGLGLAMVYSLVTGARGRITVASDGVRGTSFTMLFPAAQGAGNAGPAVAAAPVTLRGTEHVLVVEDEHAVRSATVALLSRAGYRTSVAASAEEAIALLTELSILPDLILSDVVMPHVSGPQMMAAIHERYPTLRVVYMSGYADDDTVMNGVATNVVQLVPKPFSAGDLLGAIRRTLDADD